MARSGIRGALSRLFGARPKPAAPVPEPAETPPRPNGGAAEGPRAAPRQSLAPASQSKAAAKPADGGRRPMAKLVIDTDKFGQPTASPVVEAFHATIKDLVRKKLAESGGNWDSFVFDNPRFQRQSGPRHGQ